MESALPAEPFHSPCLSVCPPLWVAYECIVSGFASTPTCNAPRGQRMMPVSCSVTVYLTPLRLGLSLNLEESGNQKALPTLTHQ